MRKLEEKRKKTHLSFAFLVFCCTFHSVDARPRVSPFRACWDRGAYVDNDSDSNPDNLCTAVASRGLSCAPISRRVSLSVLLSLRIGEYPTLKEIQGTVSGAPGGSQPCAMWGLCLGFLMDSRLSWGSKDCLWGRVSEEMASW